MTDKPVRYFIQSAQPVHRFAAAGKIMVFTMENDHSRLGILERQGLHHLHSFAQRTPVILIAVNKQRRCFTAFNILQRRMRPEPVPVPVQILRAMLFRIEP